MRLSTHSRKKAFLKALRLNLQLINFRTLNLRLISVP